MAGKKGANRVRRTLVLLLCQENVLLSKPLFSLAVAYIETNVSTLSASPWLHFHLQVSFSFHPKPISKLTGVMPERHDKGQLRVEIRSQQQLFVSWSLIHTYGAFSLHGAARYGSLYVFFFSPLGVANLLQ